MNKQRCSGPRTEPLTGSSAASFLREGASPAQRSEGVPAAAGKARWPEPDRPSFVLSARRSLGLLSAAALLSLAAPATAQPTPMFAGTAADLTHVEFAAAARRGAVVLWALGAIEQHGPHLPLGTDVYIPQAQLTGAAARLRAKGVESVILPPYYWGVNHVTGAFPGSLNIRPETMAALMRDVFQSLRKAGFTEVYCVTGHWDAAHARTIAEAVAAADGPGFRVRFVAPVRLADRLGLSGPTIQRAEMPVFKTEFPDVHAGDDETSAMLALAPGTVRKDVAKRLPPTQLDPETFEAWRTGGQTARRLTPDGYVGDPAKASASRGRARADANAKAVAEAVLRARLVPAAPR